MFFSPKSRIHRFAKVLPCQNFVLYGNPFVGEDLLCEQEVGNPYDTHTVVVKTGPAQPVWLVRPWPYYFPSPSKHLF